jgi:hypothetical protein
LRLGQRSHPWAAVQGAVTLRFGSKFYQGHRAISGIGDDPRYWAGLRREDGQGLRGEGVSTSSRPNRFDCARWMASDRYASGASPLSGSPSPREWTIALDLHRSGEGSAMDRAEDRSGAC